MCFRWLLVLSLALSITLSAREPYKAGVAVGNDTAIITASNLLDLKRKLSSDSIQELIPLYTPTSAVAIGMDIRGLEAITGFAANSTTLLVNIPRAGITVSFTGSTRDESLALFKEYLHDGGRNTRLLRAYAKYSPIDPIAGNPNSLLASLGQADYELGRLSPLAGCDCSWSAQPVVHQFQAGLKGTRSFIGGFDATAVTLPLRYTYSPDLNWALIIDAPLTYLRNGGASSLYTSLGLGLRYPLTNAWSLTALSRFGSGGSLDLCTSGTFFTAGATSAYQMNFWDSVLTITNYAGYYTSTNFWLTGVNFNYHLQNYVFKNGFNWTSCEGFSFCNRTLNLGVSFVDTYFPSRKLYIRHYDEIGFSLITTGINPCLDYDCLTLGFAYQFGYNRFKGYSLNMTYQF